MIKKITLLSALAVSAIIAFDSQFNLAISDSSGKSGAAGDPASGNKTCAQSGCHDTYGSSAFTAPASTISIKDASSNEVTSYVGGATYTITISANNTANIKSGFSCAIESGSTMKGTFTATSGNHLLNGYMTHDNTGVGNVGLNKKWTFTWVAPASGTGSLTVYATINRADNDFTSSNDSIFSTSRVITDASTGINELSNNNLFISPNPASTSIYVHAMNLNANSMVSIYSITGELMLNEKLNASNQINISNLDKGVYLVQVSNSNQSFIKKFIKE